MVVPVDTGLSPTKGELVYSRGGYSKTAKQCLQEISGIVGAVVVWFQVGTLVVLLAIV